ncbi:hypothetical protein LOY28_15440 [Pseudomonas sp. B21-017]|uniref:DUF6957 family protein n=1 Tax=Pseudomonas sp. B21-017 TaxID=2895474 RepID=UPI00215EFE6E|nr:hypothetical protein [Pseudomonas sp. B21-017]UVM36134.1 hypothetical protein LOY28_15440 [Pseudomonas sp. B21-017]
MNTENELTEILQLSTDQNEGDDELLGDPGEPRQGPMDADEILIGLVQALYPRKPYCLVENWTIFKVDVTEEELNKIHAAGQLPMILFAHNVRFDSERRFDVGDWMRSTFAVSFEEGFLFETRNTVYVLKGPGHEKAASLKTVFSFF